MHDEEHYQVKHGFLGDEYAEQYEEIQKKYGHYFELAYKLNDLSYELLNKLNGKIEENSIHKIVVTLLFIDALSSFQTLTVLCKKGLRKEINVLLRSFLELYFWVMAISQKNEIAEKYILVGEKNRICGAKNILKYRKSIHEMFGGEEKLKDQIKIYQAQYQKYLEKYNYSDKEINELKKPYKVAQAGKVPEIYYQIYSLLSNDVHSNAHSLNDNFNVNEEQRSIRYGPSFSVIQRSIGAIIGVQLHIFQVISTIFNIAEFKNKYNNINELFNQYYSDPDLEFHP